MLRQLLDLRAPAKVNLTLDVVGKRSDGYHELETIFYEVPAIYDTLAVSLTEDRTVDVQCITRSPFESVPSGRDNVVYRAAERFLRAIGDTTHGVSVGVIKGIPSQAGLGGGSSDAACTLKALNELFGYPFRDEALIELGATVGADVPFFIMGGTVYASGIGDVLTPLKPLPRLNMVVAKGTEGVSTRQAYGYIDELPNLRHIDTEAAIDCVLYQDTVSLCRYCGNVFEQTPLPDSVRTIKSAMLEHGALCSVMTGSGSAVFGIFDSYAAAIESYRRLDVPTKFLV